MSDCISLSDDRLPSSSVVDSYHPINAWLSPSLLEENGIKLCTFEDAIRSYPSYSCSSDSESELQQNYSDKCGTSPKMSNMDFTSSVSDGNQLDQQFQMEDTFKSTVKEKEYIGDIKQSNKDPLVDTWVGSKEAELNFSNVLASGEVSHSTSQSSSALSLSGECSDSPPVPSIPVIEIESEKGTLLLGNRNGFTTPTAAQTLKLTEQCEPQFVDGVVKNTNSPKDKNPSLSPPFPDRVANGDIESVPPIDLNLLSPKQTKSKQKSVKSKLSKSTSTKPKSAAVLNPASTSGLPLKPAPSDTSQTRQIAREIKLRVQKKPKEIAKEIKRRVQQQSRKKELFSSQQFQQLPATDQLTSYDSKCFNDIAFQTYDVYNELSPRIQAGDLSIWQCLPEEIWLHILSCLPLPDLHSFMLTCHDFNRISHDRSLWTKINLYKKELSDEELVKIGALKPECLSINQCAGVKLNGLSVSNKGMREMFSSLGKSLNHLSTASCVMSPMTGEVLLHHALLHCPNICYLDISWCNLSDRDIELVAGSLNNITCLLLNGNQMITDSSLLQVLEIMSHQLLQLEVQGCFKLSNSTLSRLASCKQIETLNIGQCHRFSSSHVMQSLCQLPLLKSLNMKSMKQLRDSSLRQIVKRCPKLEQLVISQCSSLTQKSLVEMACGLSDLKTLEVSSCKECVTDVSLSTLLHNCKMLQSLDVSANPITNSSLEVIASTSDHMTDLKLNFCSINEAGIRDLVSSSTHLRKLQIYGIKGVSVEELLKLNPKVVVEN
ncbi:hypothetical protein EB796_018454 [Bugula neritina]|uniref:F-box domain-containing protein n=1 Tax=Bugula neritina TaxID=10212 RepID=A0A7J7JAH8_BUGNE|nr:hypothetical protein EB796_018454 [Bugula neritina]